MYWYDHGMGWGFGLLMMLSMLLFWGLVVTGVVLLVRYLSHDRPRYAKTDGAHRILAERFARGEIDEEEFQRRADALRHHERPYGER